MEQTRSYLAFLLAACSFEPRDDGRVKGTGPGDDDDTCFVFQEICNQQDDDCDGEVDEGFDTSWFVDADQDGVGDGAQPVEGCDLGADHSHTPGDCDDSDPALVGPISDVVYVDVTAQAGLDYLHWDGSTGTACGLETWSGGAAIGDYDADGDLDVFVPRMNASDRLYRNRGDGTFSEESVVDGVDHAGTSSGALFVDVDGGGYLDLLVTSFGAEPDRLYIRTPDGYEDQALDRSIDGPVTGCSYTFGASAADYDQDDDNDLFIASWWPPGEAPSRRTRLLRNTNSGTVFVDVTASAGLDELQDEPITSGVFADFEGDGDQDLLAVGTSTSAWVNQGDGTFRRVAAPGLAGLEAMAAVFGDLDADGDGDWFLSGTNAPGVPCPVGYGCTGSRVLLTDGFFATDTAPPEVIDGGAGFAAALFDIDGDGLLDAAQAVNHDLLGYSGGSNHLWRNTASGFEEAACAADMVDRGQGRALLPFDADGDGDPDLLLISNGETPRLYEQRGGEGITWLRLSLSQTGRNVAAIGASIEIEPVLGGPVYRGAIASNATYLSSGPPELYLRLGAHVGPLAEVRVTWPDGASSTYTDVATGQVTLVR